MPHVEDNATLPSRERIKSPMVIREVLDGHRSVCSGPVRCYYRFYPSEPEACHQVALIVPKRRFHHAVDRNRLKRLMREAYRLHKHLLDPLPSTVRMCWMYQGNTLADQETVGRVVSQLLEQICKACKTSEL
ncbi:MAG: ribonuclease P protein component [Bacteroidales bacterium]|nr:ribonuclease P protein component [Bacteroidales bacterium]